MRSLSLQQTTPNTTTKRGVQMDTSGGFTIIPHWVIDNLSMSPDHFLMFCIIARKTWGTSATSAAIPNPEMKGFLRCSLNHMLKVRDELESLGYIHVQKTNGGCNSKTIYSIAVNSSCHEPLSNETVHGMNSNSSPSEPAILNKSLNNNIPPISPQGGQYAQQSSDVTASEPTASQPEPTASETKPKRKQKAPADPVTIPASINPIAWAEFVQHRKEIKKPLTDTACKKLFNLLAPFNTTTQQAMIDQSIQARWTGIFPLKAQGAAKQQTKPDPWSSRLKIDDELYADLQRLNTERLQREGKL